LAGIGQVLEPVGGKQHFNLRGRVLEVTEGIDNSIDILDGVDIRVADLEDERIEIAFSIFRMRELTGEGASKAFVSRVGKAKWRGSFRIERERHGYTFLEGGCIDIQNLSFIEGVLVPLTLGKVIGLNAFTFEHIHEWWRIAVETLGLVESSMARVLDSITVEVVVIRVTEGVTESKEYSLARIDVEFGGSFAWWKGVHTTPEHTKEPEIWTFSGTDGNGR
jgi:hypothetical protein